MDAVITKEMLEDTGLEIDEGQVGVLLEKANAVLKERVGVAVMVMLDEGQLVKVRELTQAGDNEALKSWLNENVEDMGEIVEDEIDILLGDIVKNNGVL
jgi:hypothetical protein